MADTQMKEFPHDQQSGSLELRQPRPSGPGFESEQAEEDHSHSPPTSHTEEIQVIRKHN